MTLDDCAKEFIFQKELAALSPATIKDYRNFIDIFFKYIDKSLPLDSVSYDLVSECLRRLIRGQYSKNTISTYIRNIRIFLRWIYREYGLPFDPGKIIVPKRPKKAVRVLNDAEVRFLLDSVESSFEWIRERNRAIIAFMLDSGLRLSEICGLKKENLDSDHMVAKITGKGAKDRFVPMGKFVFQLINEYLALCPYKNTEYVFLGRYGAVITQNAIKVFMNELKHKTGLDISSHKLRHNFATNFCIDSLKETGSTNTADLAAIMGHESSETTKQYEHFAVQMVAAEFHRSHLDGVYLNKYANN